MSHVNYTSCMYLCHHMILNRANTPPDVVRIGSAQLRGPFAQHIFDMTLINLL
jgi:hypothetical protein